MTTVLAIDQGTSGTEAVVVDADGRVRGAGAVDLRPTHLPAGGVEQDPRALLDSVIAAGRRAAADAGLPVDVVALANQGESVLAWDRRTGEPRSSVVVWQDRRAKTVCDDLREHGPTIAARTGLVLDPYFSAPKQAWLRRQVTTEGVVTTTDSWLLHRLTGAFVTDVTTASRSSVTDLETGEWDPELVALFGLAGEPAPRILACDEVVGTTAAFGGRAAVGGLVVDQQAALVAQRCLQAGDAKCTFGTGAFLLACTGPRPVRSASGLSASVAWRARGRTSWCLDGQVHTAGSAVRWLQELALVDTAADLDRTAAADAGGVLCVPALAGLAAPWWRPGATATLTGMSLSTTGAHLVRAVLEGIAAQVAELAACVGADLGRPLSRLRVDGGLARSTVLVQAVADLLQVPVDVHRSPHATALGAAALGRMAVTPGLALEEAVVEGAPARVHEPRWSADRAADFRTRWTAVASRT